MIETVLQHVQHRADGTWVGRRGPFVGSFHHLRAALTLAVYHELHAGQPIEAESELLQKGHQRDPDLERRIGDALAGRLRVTMVPLVSVDAPSRTAVVDLPEVRTRIGVDRLSGRLEPGRAVRVRLEAGRPALSPGYFYVQGSHDVTDGAEPVRRLYVHLRAAEHAPAALTTLVERLDDAGSVVHAKVLSTTQAYPRRDALVIYVFGNEADADTATQVVLDAIADVDGVGEQTSIFTRALRPGVGWARPQRDARAGRQALSFGQHRSAAVAEGIARFVHRTDSRSARDHLVESLLEAGVEPLRPWENTMTERTRP